MATLIEDLEPGPVGLDTAIFIYLIEEDPRFLRFVRPVFESIERQTIRAVTSGLTLLEVLVVPYRSGDLSLAKRYEVLLTRSRGLRLIELDRSVLRGAARLRAATRLGTADAIQIAAAAAGGCPVFLTNDRKIASTPGVKVLQLRDYLRAD